MFNKVRNRILLLNMAMVSAVVVIAFAVIFMTTYTRVQNDNREKLMNSSVPQMLFYSGPFTQGNLHAEPGVTGSAVSGFARRISPDAGLSFSVLADSKSNVIDINSMVDLPESAYGQAASMVMSAYGKSEAISLEGRMWQYKIFPITIAYRENNGSSVAFASVEGEFSNIRFLDVTDSYQMINSLALMLTGLTVIILAAYYFISRYFANRAIRPMEEAWEKQGRFIADASHELKTPLSIINADCGVLYAGEDETVKSQLKWVDSIARAADRMSGLVSSLLSLARMEDTQHPLQIRPFNLSLTVADAVSEMEAGAAQKGLGINKQIEPDIEIESDREHIRQILSVLLDNAVKYTGEGGEVTVSLRKGKRHITCSVKNSGQGIPDGDMPRLFDRFYRGDPARSSENRGYGLGLAIAKAAAERINAQLTPGGKSGEYTEFSLLLKTKP